MPVNDGLGFHDHKCFAPAGPHAGQSHPKQAVGQAEGRPERFALHDGQLLAQGEVFQVQRRAAEESLTERGKDEINGRAHAGDAIRPRPEILGFLPQLEFMGGTPDFKRRQISSRAMSAMGQQPTFGPSAR